MESTRQQAELLEAIKGAERAVHLLSHNRVADARREFVNAAGYRQTLLSALNAENPRHMDNPLFAWLYGLLRELGRIAKDPQQVDQDKVLDYCRDIREHLGGVESIETTANSSKAPAGRKGQPADDLIIAALSALHRYDAGAVEHGEPFDQGTIAKTADVASGTVSKFWKKQERWFGSYEGYCRSCRTKDIVGALKFLNLDFSDMPSFDPAKMDEHRKRNERLERD